jgi:hypothetical protein
MTFWWRKDTNLKETILNTLHYFYSDTAYYLNKQFTFAP